MYLSSLPLTTVELDVAFPSADHLQILLGTSSMLLSLQSSDGKIDVLSNRTLAGVPGLTDLDLSSNWISFVFPGAFAAQSRLVTLMLGSNFITSILPGTFAPLTSLRCLDFALTRSGGISLQLLPLHDATSLGALEGLSLKGNRELGDDLETLQAGVLLQLVNLTELFLDDIPFPGKKLPVFLANLTALTHLSLGSCNLEVLHAAPLLGLTSLQGLIIAYNTITAVEPGAFLRLPSPARVIMSPGNPSLSEITYPWSWTCASPLINVNDSGCVAPCVAATAPYTLHVSSDQDGTGLAVTRANCTVTGCPENNSSGLARCAFDGTWVADFPCHDCHATTVTTSAPVFTTIFPFLGHTSTAAPGARSTMKVIDHLQE